MGIFYKLTQTWLWQMVFILPLVLSILPIPLLLPICIVGTAIEQPEEWPLVFMWFGLCTVGFLTWIIEDKNINK